MKTRFLIVSVVLMFQVWGCTRPGKYLLSKPPTEIDPLPIRTTAGAGSAAADPLEKKQWSRKKIEADKVLPVYTGNHSDRIMILGTGINYNHPDLRSAIDVNLKEFEARKPHMMSPINGIDDDRNGFVDDIVGWDFVNNDGFAYSHHLMMDTHAAGVIGAVHNNGLGIKGIVKNALIYPVRYIGTNGLTKFTTFIRALRHIVVIKPRVVLLNVVNFQYFQEKEVQDVERFLIDSVLKEIYNAKIPVVVGAGNIGLPIDNRMRLINQLAVYPNVFIVSSTDEVDQRGKLANYNPGFVHTMAPGVGVLTTGLNDSWQRATGTYVAAAQVAGAVALAVSAFGRFKDYKKFFDTLLSAEGSDVSAGLGSSCFGSNRLNVRKFLAALKRQ